MLSKQTGKYMKALERADYIFLPKVALHYDNLTNALTPTSNRSPQFH